MYACRSRLDMADMAMCKKKLALHQPTIALKQGQDPVPRRNGHKLRPHHRLPMQSRSRPKWPLWGKSTYVIYRKTQSS